MEIYREWRYSSNIHDLGTGWRQVISFTSLPLYVLGTNPCSKETVGLGKSVNFTDVS
jgi:hypothetical protein